MKIIMVGKKQIIGFGIIICVILVSIFYSLNIWPNTFHVFNIDKRQLPIYCVDTKEKKVAVSFDAAWGAEYTPQILDILDKYKVKSTFFLVGFWVDKYPEKVKMIADRGNEIGNHSTNHPHMPTLSHEQMLLELETTRNKITAITKQKVILFRPPFGDYNNLLIQTANESGYFPIQWSVDSLDWKEFGVEPMVKRVMSNVKPGSIILFHNNSKYITQALPIILQKLQDEGYKVVPVSQLIYKNNYEIDNTGMQKKITTSN